MNIVVYSLDINGLDGVGFLEGKIDILDVVGET